MKRFFFTLLVTLTAFAAAWADAGGYYIDRLSVKAHIDRSNRWTVTEIIDVVFTSPRHGIYRYIPTVFYFENEDAKHHYRDRYVCTIDDVEVIGGAWEEADIANEAEDHSIRIGSADEYVSGAHQYVIKYTYTYPDDRWQGYDILYHTVLGTDWDVPINHFEFALTFDKAIPQSALDSMDCYVGAYGSRNNMPEIIEIADGHHIVGSLDSLKNNTGVTLMTRLPEGFYENTKKVSPILAYICFGGAALCFLICIGALFLKPRRKPVVQVEFHAPEGISSADVGTIIDDSADVSDLASLIPWWASKGYISISEVPDSYGRTGKHCDLELTKLGELPPNTPNYQKIFHKAVFHGSSVVTLSNLGDRHTTIALAQEQLTKRFNEKGVKLTRYSNAIYLYYLGLVLAALGVATGTAIELFEMTYAVLALFLFIGPVMTIIIVRAKFSAEDSYVKGWKYYAQIIGGVLLSAFCMMCISYFIYDESPNTFVFPSEIAQGILGVGFFIAILSGRFRVDTDYRLQMMGKILGLKRFIKTAEKDRLRMLVDENPEYFYSILPYAMVFGLTGKWAAQFKGIDMPASRYFLAYNDGSAMATGFMGSSFIDSFGSRFNDQIRDSIKASSHDPSSSSSSFSGFSGGGSSFGGFSGGGGGGGGGGSW